MKDVLYRKEMDLEKNENRHFEQLIFTFYI